jgi:hypothetical protein
MDIEVNASNTKSIHLAIQLAEQPVGFILIAIRADPFDLDFLAQ